MKCATGSSYGYDGAGDQHLLLYVFRTKFSMIFYILNECGKYQPFQGITTVSGVLAGDGDLVVIFSVLFSVLAECVK